MKGLLTKACTVKLQNFEGPLDLLFHFIEKSKISIYDIEISEITEQYMSYLYTMKKLDMGLASEFLVMAATLLHIKSRSVLPIEKNNQKSDPEEEMDSKEKLILRLIEYKKIKEAAKMLQALESEWVKVFYGSRENLRIKPTYYMPDLTPEHLKDAYDAVLDRNLSIAQSNKFSVILRHDKVSVKDKILEIFKVLTKRLSFRFFEVFDVRERNRPEVVAGFMAILELAKLNKVSVVQDGLFEEIYVHRQK